MVRSRENSESIAMERGQPVECQQMELRFSRVAANYLRLIGMQKRLSWFTTFFGQVAAVFPYMVAAPHYFRGPMSLGDLTQVVDAFGNVQGALSWFVNNYNAVASWRATTDRLTGFERAISEMEPRRPIAEPSDFPATTCTELQVRLPEGNVLLSDTAFEIRAGENIYINGPSGAGKSTLFRTLAGIWPYASGHIGLAADSMFLPQRPYFPNGPLRDALSYPSAPSTYSDAELQSALEQVGLESLCQDLDVFESWNHMLSGGEQQKLALARVFLKKPRWVFADEATSALDAAAEAMLYQRLAELVSQRGGALVSIAHRPSVAAFHQRHWVLEPQPAGSEALFKLAEKPA
jgi:putative ATP-binding cassette transporter